MTPATRAHRPAADWPFTAAMWALVGAFVLFLLALVYADVFFLLFDRQTSDGGPRTLNPQRFADAFASVFQSDAIAASIRLTLVSCTVTALLSVLVAVPIGYALARARFPGRSLIDAVIDIPIVLPPLVVGLSLLILFANTPWGRSINDAFGSLMTHHLPSLLTRLDGVLGPSPGPLMDAYHALGIDQWRTIYYTVPGVVLAQFSVSSAFAVRTMRVTFDQLDPRREHVALTLGCSRFRAFRRVVLPEAMPGVVAAGCLAWARALGEFGPILVFAAATRGRTEVLSSTVFLEAQIGELEKAVAVSLLMVAGAMVVLTVTRVLTGSNAWAVARRTLRRFATPPRPPSREAGA